MNTRAAGERGHVPFPLYHGSSTHYLAHFRPGRSPSEWPYGRAALDLHRLIWTELKRFGRAPDWWQEEILAQQSGPANWQHGQLYVTPSKASAVSYAGGGAAHGGELLQSCRNALDELARLDPGKTTALLDSAKSVGRFLEQTGRPILTEFTDVQASGLSPERVSDEVSKQLAELIAMDERTRAHVGKGINFRLAPGCGVVARVFEVSIDDVDNPVSDFQLREILNSDVWTGS